MFKKGDTIRIKKGRITREINRVLHVTCASEHVYIVKNKFDHEFTLTQIEATKYEKIYSDSDGVDMLISIFNNNSNEPNVT